jgi:hypothetical protein
MLTNKLFMQSLSFHVGREFLSFEKENAGREFSLADPSERGQLPCTARQ